MQDVIVSQFPSLSRSRRESSVSSLARFIAAATTSHHHHSPPTTYRSTLTFSTSDSFLLLLRSLLRNDGEEDGSHRLRSTATPQARLVLLLLYLADLQWRRHSAAFFPRLVRTNCTRPDLRCLKFRRVIGQLWSEG